MLFLLFQKYLRRHEGDKTWNVTIQKLEKWQKSSSYQHLIKNILLKHLWYEIFYYAPPPKKKDRKTRGIFPKCNKSWILKHKFTYVLFLSQWKQFIKLFYGIIKISLKNVHFFYFALFCQFMQLHRSFV